MSVLRYYCFRWLLCIRAYVFEPSRPLACNIKLVQLNRGRHTMAILQKGTHTPLHICKSGFPSFILFSHKIKYPYKCILMLRATHGHYGGSTFLWGFSWQYNNQRGSRFWTLGRRPTLHVWGPMCSTSALFILQAIGTALVLDAVARRIHKIE